MFETFYPDECVDSTYEIDFKSLYNQGLRGILFDIDNTLVPHGFPADDRAIELFRRLHEMGFNTMALSNNKKPRVKSFCDVVGTDYIYKANKPFKDCYINAMKNMGTDVNSTLFVGDQLFTDVWGAKRLGIRNILVKPIDSKEEIQIVLKRYLEKIVLNEWKKKKS